MFKPLTRINPGKLLIHTVFLLFSALCILPFLYVVSISVSSEKDVALEGFKLIPKTFTWFAYEYLLSTPGQLLNAYGVTISVTVIGTAMSLLLTAKLAYSLSRRDFRWGNLIAFIVFFTLLFNGGLVPWYIMITKYMHLNDTIWALILPYVMMPWHILLMKGFLADIPPELVESAKIDGAGEWRVFYQIIMPITKPALATLGLFIAFIYWNDWWLGMLFVDNPNLVPLQYMLYRIMNNISFLTNAVRAGNISIPLDQFPNESARMAIAILASGPMLLAFPFFQKYFIKGLTVGAVKG